MEGKIGGDADLSPQGIKYAQTLPKLIEKHIGDRPLTVWTSSMKRTIQTASYLNYPKKHWKALDELNTGVCDGMTYEEIAVSLISLFVSTGTTYIKQQEQYPEDFARRDEDKFNYRYRGGEVRREILSTDYVLGSFGLTLALQSYRDLVLRLEPVIMELERHENILIIAHQATIRCMYAYFMNLDHEELPYARIPLHTVIELIPQAYQCIENLYKGNEFIADKEVSYPHPDYFFLLVDIDAVDTYRPKVPRLNKLKELEGVPSKNTAGASGEIADGSSPILPLSPRLYPKNPSTLMQEKNDKEELSKEQSAPPICP